MKIQKNATRSSLSNIFALVHLKMSLHLNEVVMIMRLLICNISLHLDEVIMIFHLKIFHIDMWH